MTTTSMNTLFSMIAEKLGGTLIQHSPLTGGDISSVELLETNEHRLVVKSSTDTAAADMFEQEILALTSIADTQTIAVPDVYLQGCEGDLNYLVMDYVASKKATLKDFERFGAELAELHAVSNPDFGWLHDNYIGSLQQSNKAHADWPIFYVQERLLPQFRMAFERKLLSAQDMPSEEVLMTRAYEILPSTTAALLHGDLWSGNFLIAQNGAPYLIDPAIYYGHGEVDLAMSRLFGGFDEIFYKAYHAVHHAQEGIECRQDWYKLYYLLVHLNIFGGAYFEAVKKIVARYF